VRASESTSDAHKQRECSTRPSRGCFGIFNAKGAEKNARREKESPTKFFEFFFLNFLLARPPKFVNG
jgi:hypothetical protein